MGEWERIYKNPRRIFILILITVLSVVFFFYSRMSYFGPGSVSALIYGERYYVDVVDRSHGLSDDELGELLALESAAVDSYYMKLQGNDHFALLTYEELADAVKESPFLSSLEALDEEDAMRRLKVASLRIAELSEQSEYISGYAEYLDKIQKQAEMQSMTSIFGDENSFSHRNIVKTAREFDTLRGVEVEFGANRAYEGWIEYELADYFYLLVIIIFVLAFLEERRAGLWCIIRSCKDGRGRLALERVAILASASVLGVMLIFGVNLIFSLTLSGGWGDTDRAIQSMVGFRTFTQHITIGEFIAEYLVVKSASGFMVGLLLWSILGTISNVQYSVAVLGAILAVEYVLFAFLPVQSILNPIKYFNLFSYIRTSKLYTEYLNIDLFGYPFGIRRTAFLWLPIFIAVFFSCVILVSRRRPEGRRDIISVVVGVWDRVADFFRRRLTAGGWEAYKMLVFERGIVLLVVIFLVSGSLSFSRFYYGTGGNTWYMAYLDDMAGPITDETDEYIEKARANAEGNSDLMAVLNKVEAHVEELRERAEAGGYEPWITTREVRYRGTYGPDAEDLQRINAAAAIVFVTVSCAALMSFENQSGVAYMIRSQKRGRGYIILRKLITALAVTAFSFAAVYLREYISFSSAVLPDIAAPIRNFDSFASFPLNITMGQYILILYAVRFVALCILSVVVMLVSSYIKTIESSYMICLLLFGVPALLFALGIDVMRFISPVLAVSSAEGMWALGAGLGGVDTAMTLTWAVWLAVGIAAVILLCRRWCSTGGKGGKYTRKDAARHESVPD